LPGISRSRSSPVDVGALEADAIGALCRLGVAPAHARAAVTAAAGSGPTEIEDLLRQAFGVLHRTVYASRFAEARG